MSEHKMSAKDRGSKFTLGRMMLGMLFVSLLMAATFVQSEVVFAFSATAILILVVWHCFHNRWLPVLSGALIGFTFPALMALHIFGEQFAPVRPSEFQGTESNLAIAIMTLVFVGGAGAWFGMLVGMVVGIVKDKIKG